MKRAALLVALALTACGPRDLLVLDLASLDGGLPRHRDCTADPDCPGGFCERDGCGAPLGHCAPTQVYREDVLLPECGCNDVTYWNGSLRRAAGVSLRAPGECASPAPCDAATACPDAQAKCSRLLPPLPACAATPPGACWVVPASCPTAALPAEWAPCGGGACLDACQAIRSERPHHRSPACP